MQEWDWEQELAEVESDLVKVELTLAEVSELARYLPSRSNVLAKVEVSMRESGSWMEPAAA